MNRRTITTLRRVSLVAAAGVIAFVSAPRAEAFFPLGGSPADAFTLRFIRWEFDDLDTNGDGDISGPDEGVDVTYEGGALGFTDEEMLVLDEAFNVWENVPSAFLGFRTTLTIEDPTSTDVPDGLNIVSLQVEDEEGDPNFGDFAGVTVLNFALMDGFITSPDGNTTVPITGGRIFEADIVIDAAAIRGTGTGAESLLELKSIMVHQIGLMLGLSENPMHNLEAVTNPDDPDGDPLLFESPALSWRDEFNNLNEIGATPSLFPTYFFLDDGTGEVRGGMEDLAVDDVAGVTFLYGRESAEEDFFTITGEARTQVRPGFASSPILGGLVIGWADTDDNPITSRVPLISTMTGLYVYRTEELLRGVFDLRGLPKLLETAGLSTPFEATYTLTIEPLNGTGIVADGPEVFDSTHTLEGDPGWEDVEYDTAFPSEVFHIDGGFFGRNNYDAGSALKWDEDRNTVVVAASGEALSNVLSGGKPMFGDQSDICPLLIIEDAAGVTLGPSLLRGLRDNVLLQSAVGAAFVDFYYQTGPAMASLVANHKAIKAIGVTIAQTVEWILRNPIEAALLVSLALGAAVVLRRHRKRAATVGLLVGFGAYLLAAVAPADAVLRYLSDEQKVERSDAVVHGAVIMVESREQAEGAKFPIRTDVIIEVLDPMKGDSGTGSTVSLNLPGGRVGNKVTKIPELPEFAVGEEVILYLKFVDGHGYIVTGGSQGKVVVATNPDTGAKFVQNSTFAAHQNSAKRKTPVGLGVPAPLDAYKRAIADAVQRQTSGD